MSGTYRQSCQRLTLVFLQSPLGCFAAASAGETALSLLDEEMRNEETEIRIEAMRRLETVAAALGPAATVEKLVPFLIGEILFSAFCLVDALIGPHYAIESTQLNWLLLTTSTTRSGTLLAHEAVWRVFWLGGRSEPIMTASYATVGILAPAFSSCTTHA